MNNIYLINNNKFKGINISIEFTLDIQKEDISRFCILSSILSKCSGKYTNQTEIQRHLFNLYGSTFETHLNKIGDLYNIEFSMEFVNKKFLENKDMLKPCLEFLYEIIYNPIFKEGNLDDIFLSIQKENIIQKINSIKDDKMLYAIYQSENLMSPDTLFGGCIYGSEQEISKINIEDIKNTYNEFITKSCINILISGNLDGYDNIYKEVESIFSDKLKNNIKYNELIVNKQRKENEFKEVIEKDIVNQNIVTVILGIKDVSIDDYYKIMMYNCILGGTSSSKLFQNVREKKSLAYTVSSRYYKFKNYILIYAGIDNKNYEKTKKVIKKEINNMINNISKEEFESAKESLLSDLNEWSDSKIISSKIKFNNLFYYKNDNVNIEKMYQEIKNVGIDDVKEIAKKVYISNIYMLGGDENA